MAKPRNTKIMIYVAHTDSKTRPHRSHSIGEDRLTGPGAQLKSCMEQHPLAQAGGHKHSLVFGPAIVRKNRSGLHSCSARETEAGSVNRLWYGRALVALRTYPQWTLRSAAIEQYRNGMGEPEGSPIKLGSPIQ